MIGKFSPLQLVVLIALGSVGLLAPESYQIRAIVGIVVSAGMFMTFYQYAFGSKRNNRAELTHRVKLIPRLIPHRIFFSLSLFTGLLSIVCLLNPDFLGLGLILATVAIFSWLISRVFARNYLGGAGSWSLFFGTAPIFYPPPAQNQPSPQTAMQTSEAPTEANFGYYGASSPVLPPAKASEQDVGARGS